MLVTNALVGGIFFTQLVHCCFEVCRGDLSVSTSQELKNSIMNEYVLFLYIVNTLYDDTLIFMSKKNHKKTTSFSLLVYRSLDHFHPLVASLDNCSINVYQTFCFDFIQDIVQSYVSTCTTHSSTGRECAFVELLNIMSSIYQSFAYLQCTTRGPDEGTWWDLISRWKERTGEA